MCNHYRQRMKNYLHSSKWKTLIIALDETWLDTQNKHLLAEVTIHGYKVFHVDKPTPTGRGGGSIMYIKNTLNPMERKSSATCTGEIIYIYINPKNAAPRIYTSNLYWYIYIYIYTYKYIYADI